VLEELCKAPSYRAICRAILKNDVSCVSLGFAREKTDAYMAIKKVEIDERIRRKQAKD
jgi:predicted phosphoadenosine phosphosulfate sulfurtransferase